MELSGDALTECPACHYDLTGLPKTHRCPECGFEYDETMRVLWTPDRRARWLFVIEIILLALFAPQFVALSLKGFDGWQAYCGVAWLVGVAFYVPLLWRARRTRAFVLVGAEGLCYRAWLSRVERIPWQSVRYPGETRIPHRTVAGRMRAIRLPMRRVFESERWRVEVTVYQAWREATSRSNEAE